MAKRGRRPHPRGRQAGQDRHWRQARPAKARPAPARGPRAPDLLADARRLLAGGEPLDFLGYVSSLLAAVDPRGQNPFEHAERPQPVTLPQLLESFVDVVLPETTALLAAIAELGPDELTRARARRALPARPHPLPDWLAGLGGTSVYRAVESSHVLGDGDSVLLAARMPGHELTAIIYIDHNLGTVVKDAFPAPSPVSDVVGRMREAMDDPDVRYADIGLADARARVAQAIELGAITFPPFETETWPASRPLTEWLLRLLPEGGTGYVRPVWNKAAKKKLANRFFGSQFGRPLDDGDHRDLLDQFLWFGTDYGPGDPLRWSPVAVEMLLADWIPRKVVADPGYLSKAPALLRAFIRFCHAERGIRPALTEQTLAAVGKHEPEYQRVIRSPRTQGPMALLAAMGVLDDQGWEDEPSGFHRHFLDQLAEEVGGQDALDSLDDAPLPEEEFGWGQVPAGARDRVGQVLAACDRCCEELLGGEYPTACRRLLARAVPGLAGMLQGPGRPEVIAAAVCWVIGQGNQRFGQRQGELRVKDLMGYFGLSRSSVAERGYRIMRAAGIPPSGAYPAVRLGSPGLLVSARRRRIIELRDHHRAAICGERRA
jgi:hypothetical protein